MGGMDVSYLGAFGAGLLSFLSPCVLPLVPPYLCFLGGVSLDELTAESDAARKSQVGRRVFVAAFAFVLGFATVFITLGATASFAGQWLARHIDVLAQAAGVVIIVLGLHFLGAFRIGLLYREARVQVATRPAGIIGAYIIGLAFAFGWTPCVGPVLAAILFVAGSSDRAWDGASLLGTYAAGLGIPFLLAALGTKPFLTFSRRFRRHLGMVEKAAGALLVGTGVLFLTGSMADVANWLLETMPALGGLG
ncbi:MAG TPA: cytochrome c biogenesis protein CcdA [Azospirillum sp.]